MANTKYIMENEREGLRLQIKGDHESTLEQLVLTGLERLPAVPHVVDAGCGSGFVSKIMAEVLEKTYGSARLSLLDGSRTRLDIARRELSRFSSLSIAYEESELESLTLDTDCADYVFSRFVFEYLRNTEVVFRELLRVTKPGGKLVVGDLDFNCLLFYPIDPILESRLHAIMGQLSAAKYFDPFVGRKLYSLFHQSGLENVRVTVRAHNLYYGKLRESDDFNWTEKMARVAELAQSGILKVDFDVREFGREFMTLLREPGRFSYAPLILVEGTKPHPR